MEKCRSVPHEHSSAYYGCGGGYDYEDVGGGHGKSYSFNGPSARDDPEAKRRRRVAGYKAYAVEARVKASLRNGFRWIKDRCTGLVRRY